MTTEARTQKKAQLAAEKSKLGAEMEALKAQYDERRTLLWQLQEQDTQLDHEIRQEELARRQAVADEVKRLKAEAQRRAIQMEEEEEARERAYDAQHAQRQQEGQMWGLKAREALK